MILSFLETLVPALLHTLWIGLLCATGLLIALHQIPAQRAPLRYGLSLTALIALFLGGFIAWELPSTPETKTQPLASQITAIITPPTDTALTTQNIQPSPIQQVAATQHPLKKSNWQKWVGILWLAGAILSFLRLIHISLGVRQQVRQSRVVTNPTAIRLAQELAKIAEISRRILLLTGEHIVQPAVAGIFRPVLFLPLSALTGLPEWQLRAILAHEIAHIARNDFLINALQLLTETILFFNPAAVWIHRRIREEREACCDALAAEWIDSPHELAETLIEQAAEFPSALPAFGNAKPGTLKNRILRLLTPSRTPNLKLPWKSLLLVALFAFGGLTLAKCGTAEAAGYMKRMRILTDIQKEHDNPAKTIQRNTIHLFDEVTIEIPVRISGDIPSLFPAVIYFDCGPNGYGIAKNLSIDDLVEQSGDRFLFRKTLKKLFSKIGCIDSFYIENTNFGRVESAGAPADENGVIRLPEVELQASFKGTLRFITPDGAPVTNVTATGGTIELNRLTKTGPFYTMPSCSQTPVNIQIIPPDGYINETRDITFEPHKITDWTLQRGTPFSGMIVDPQGAPVAGADIRLAGGPENRGLWRVTDWPVMATTDTAGRFSFTRMAEGEPYNLLMMANGYMGQSSGLITAQESGKTFTLRPQKRVELRLKNTQLLKRKKVELSMSVRLSPSGSYGTRLPEEWCKLVSSDSTSAIYELSNLWEGDSRYARNNTLRIGQVSHDFDPLKIGNTLTIDIAEKLPPGKRAIPHTFTIRLVPPNNKPIPQGSLEILHFKEIGGYKASFSIPPDGVIHADLMTTPKSEVRLSSKAITGYKVDHTFTADSTNMVVNIPLISTGCIMVTCTDENGNPQTDYSVTFETQGQQLVYSRYPLINDSVYINDTIPLNQPHRVWVWETTPDGSIQTEHETDWFTLTDDHPLKKIFCTLRDPLNIRITRQFHPVKKMTGILKSEK